jgi:cytochrome c peroxidase
MRLLRAFTLITGLSIAIITSSITLVSRQVSEPATQATDEHFGVGSNEVFLTKYLAYRDQQIKAGNESVLRVGLGYVKGLSRSFNGMGGELAIDLTSGKYALSVSGLGRDLKASVWLLDEGTSPDLDVSLKLLDVAGAGEARFAGNVTPTVPPGFAIDRVIVARGTESAKDVIASGSLNVLQKIFLKRLRITEESSGATLYDDVRPAAPALASLVPDVAAETKQARPVPVSDVSPGFSALSGGGGFIEDLLLDILISQGARLFFEETFNGNGRTCGTCHPASRNFTIDAAFIATLPLNDPLFVAEFNPLLAQLERPALMRSHGLILENVDGLEDPTNKFVMRGVPHTLGLQVSLTADTSQVPTPAEMTGWSGDGAPGTGSLHEFAIGAVRQHFTKRLARVEGRDFRLPREHQLDAMEAFQLSLGRDADFNLALTTFLDPAVEDGKTLFVNGTGDPNAGGRCAGCHVNAGAIATNGLNRNFNTNVEDVVHPAQSIQPFPHDGGFGSTPANPDGTFGNRAFNLTSAVEAADTAPFFHNNLVSTLEGVLGFYTGPEFNGPRAPAARFAFTPTQSANIANFLRAINAVQNVNVAIRELDDLVGDVINLPAETQRRLQTAFTEAGDAIAVLNQGGIFPGAIPALTTARQKIALAQQTQNPLLRRLLMQQAIAQLETARNTIATLP